MHPLALPWLLLVDPSRGWRLVAVKPVVWGALIIQWLILCLGIAASARPTGELLDLIGGPAGISAFSAALGALVLILIGTLAFAAIALAWARVLALALPFRDLLAWTAFAATPIYLGRLLGLLSFAVVQPLAGTSSEALQLQLNPHGLNLAGLFAPLSLPWLLAAWFDPFTLWTLLLLGIGSRGLLGLTGGPRWALLAALVLSWPLALTIVWQGLLRGQ
jgi:hypothetical protein